MIIGKIGNGKAHGLNAVESKVRKMSEEEKQGILNNSGELNLIDSAIKDEILKTRTI